MEGLQLLQELYVPTVLTICLGVGYILKHWISDVDNRIIPTALAISGAVCACINARDVSLDVICAGLITGLASTGMHQAFKQFIENK